MRNLILATFICFTVLSCASKKKTSQMEEKTQTEKDSSLNSNIKNKDTEETESKKASTTENSNTKTTIKYTPEIDKATGTLKPFKYETKKEGKPQTSIEINGSGEVLIENITSEVKEQTEEMKKYTKSLEEKIDLLSKSVTKSESEKKALEKEVKDYTFKLWLIIIILSLLLLISGYFHVIRIWTPV